MKGISIIIINISGDEATSPPASKIIELDPSALVLKPSGLMIPFTSEHRETWTPS